ncbi:hypothetical protein CTA2_7002 [Colletotrichum tanaceti]|uniref:Uncharacterized protein n=1 Tax=Colletotrichum tanaceti TaxID=1306861 RepID=A0A4U6X084_9PEZI|nr:hypothetical protein CTA2_7002 [Colletotrichum tanaceti]TKW48750.1 hypothetical protein CTA1_12523 [Colletotrichum tanaceti]
MAIRTPLLMGLMCIAAIASSSKASVAARGFRQFDCSPSSSTGLRGQCWAQLDVSKYIRDWLAENATKADCDTLGFAQCYLEFNGYGGRTCDTLTRDTCAGFETRGDEAELYYSPQQFYTLWNIHAIYQFFNQYSEALWNGHSLAASTIDDIVATVSPSTDPQVPSTLLWTSISGGFWLAAAAGVNPVLSTIAAGMAVATGMSSFFMPQSPGSSNDRFVTLGKVGSSLAELVKEYQGSLQDSLRELQRDGELFIAAAEPGGFSQRAVTSLNFETETLYHDLQLFILSLSLKANGIVSARSTGVDALEYAPKTNGAVSCPGLGPAGNCNQFWIDPDTRNTYALHNPSDGKNTYVDVLDKIHEKRWANLSEIFKVEDCTGKDPSFDGKTRVTCLASHGYCEYNYADQDTVGELREAKKQFTNCDNDKSWMTLCNWMNGGVVLPQSYLGPLLTQTGPTWCRQP